MYKGIRLEFYYLIVSMELSHFAYLQLPYSAFPDYNR